MNDTKRVAVSDIMREDVSIVDGKITVMEALKVMKRDQTTSLIVDRRNEDDEYGIVQFSDIAKQVLASDKAPERVNVYEIMAKPVISVRPNMDIRYCARLFERFGIGRAPVMDGEKMIGIVSYYTLVLHGLTELD